MALTNFLRLQVKASSLGDYLLSTSPLVYILVADHSVRVFVSLDLLVQVPQIQSKGRGSDDTTESEARQGDPTWNKLRRGGGGEEVSSVDVAEVANHVHHCVRHRSLGSGSRNRASDPSLDDIESREGPCAHHKHASVPYCSVVRSDHHDVANDVQSKGPHDEDGPPACSLRDERVGQGGEKAKDVDRSCEEQALDLPVAEGLDDGWKEVGPGLRGKDADLDEDQGPDFEVGDSGFQSIFDAANFVNLVVDCQSKAVFGIPLFLFCEPGLGS